MKILTSTGDLEFYAAKPADLIRLFGRTSFRHLDYNFYYYGSAGHVFTLEDDSLWKREMEAVLEVAGELGISFHQAHAPDGFCFGSREERERLLLSTERSIRACAMLGIDRMTVHAHSLPVSREQPGGGREDFFKANREYFASLLPLAADCGVYLMVENSSPRHAPDYYLFDGRDMTDFLAYVNHPYLKICWDTGHANESDIDQYRAILEMGSELYGLHVQDNFGDADSHLMPMMGITNFSAVIQGLLDIDYRHDFALEGMNGLRGAGRWPHFRRSFVHNGTEDRRLLNPSLELKISYVNLMYDTARWMLETYGIEVER
ncbi:MAG: sugar phosphate isomerase/epimerase family protein [Bacillota bacterium]|nr:sugar phosphate isomerase/epimerase family protein [Bacillota bacterium]